MLKELREKRAKLLEKLNAMSKKADEEKRDFTEQEDKEFNEVEAEIKGLTSKIEREERLVSYNKEFSTKDAGLYEPAGDTRATQDKNNATSKSGWKNFGEFLGAVVRAGSPGGTIDKRLIETRAASGLNETVPSEGGFMVQTDFAEELLKRTYEKGVLASRVRRIPISARSNGLKINAIDESSRVDGSRFGGVQAYWASEAGTVSVTKPKFRQMELTLNKLMGLCYLTDELMEDATALEAVTKEAFSDEFAFKIDDAILRGTGAGQPLGILNSPALVTQTKEGGQAAATVQKENIVKMRARLWARSRANSVWFINQDVEPSLNLLTLGDLGAYFPAGSFANQPYDQLFSRPVLPIEHASTLGTVGDICLFDLNEYLMIDKGDMQYATSIHVRFVYDEMALRFTYRCDGEPIWNAPLTPYKGSATKSPFVTLETRA